MPDVTGKIKRKFMAHYIDSALPSASKAEYFRLGKDLEEYTVEMNANVETKNNILGETSVTLDSYQPQASTDPYYAEVGEPLFARLQAIVDERQTLDDLKTSIVEVLMGNSNSRENMWPTRRCHHRSIQLWRRYDGITKFHSMYTIQEIG